MGEGFSLGRACKRRMIENRQRLRRWRRLLISQRFARSEVYLFFFFLAGNKKQNTEYQLGDCQALGPAIGIIDTASAAEVCLLEDIPP